MRTGYVYVEAVHMMRFAYKQMAFHVQAATVIYDSLSIPTLPPAPPSIRLSSSLASSFHLILINVEVFHALKHLSSPRHFDVKRKTFTMLFNSISHRETRIDVE